MITVDATEAGYRYAMLKLAADTNAEPWVTPTHQPKKPGEGAAGGKPMAKAPTGYEIGNAYAQMQRRKRQPPAK